MMDIELRHRVLGRVYGLTVLRSLFGDAELWIQWGPSGAPSRIRQRVEIFEDLGSLLLRRRELLMVRARHGYEVVGAERAAYAAKIRAPRWRACFESGCAVRLRCGHTRCARHRRAKVAA